MPLVGAVGLPPGQRERESDRAALPQPPTTSLDTPALYSKYFPVSH